MDFPTRKDWSVKNEWEREISTRFTWLQKCPGRFQREKECREETKRSMEWQGVILREKGVTEYGKRRPSKGMCHCPLGWADGEDRDGLEKKEREENGEERYIGDAKRKEQNRQNGSADLSWTSFIFSPRLNIKDNLIIGRFSKAGRISLLFFPFPFPPSSFLSLLLHLHPLFLYRIYSRQYIP